MERNVRWPRQVLSHGESEYMPLLSGADSNFRVIVTCKFRKQKPHVLSTALYTCILSYRWDETCAGRVGCRPMLSISYVATLNGTSRQTVGQTDTRPMFYTY